MRITKIIAGLLFIGFVVLLVWAIRDNKLNPDCYKINRTYSNIEQRYINPNVIDTIIKNDTSEVLPDCYIFRQKLISYIRAVLIAILTWLAVDFLWRNRSKLKDIIEGTKKEKVCFFCGSKEIITRKNGYYYCKSCKKEWVIK